MTRHASRIIVSELFATEVDLPARPTRSSGT
jgi:hypothetical protein